jgi:Tfp pilus assembly protein FimV
MKKLKYSILAANFLAAGLLAGGCGASHVQSGQLPAGSPGSASAAALKPSVASGVYIVRKNDTLWAIAGKSAIYGDPFEWPEIFKANRDKVADPDLIYPQQAFRIEKGLADNEVEHAKKLAMETPKYVPHETPRQTLPIDYF